jgi:LPXTG-motif cell wall-anchored protein
MNMRTLIRVGTVVSAAATALLLGPAVPAALASPNGDNGTVKIHDAATDEELPRNEPHVCEFYLTGSGYDAGQEVTWTITEMPPTGSRDTVAASGELVLGAEGAGRSDDLSLPDGHYKLYWEFEGQNGSADHKVFWVECPQEEEPGEDGASAGGPGAGEETEEPVPGDEEPTPGEGTPDEEMPGEETPGDTPAGESPAGGTDEDGQAGGDLADTGSSTPVLALSVGAAALLGAGGYLALRRRNAARPV